MIRKASPLLAVALLAIAAGCTPSSRIEFDQTAGSKLDTGDFGNPTMNNHLVMTGQRVGTVDLSRRFASEAPTTITFDFNRADLDANSRTALDAQAQWIQTHPGVRFRVYGHTDKVGSNGYNRHLGQRRANAVVNYLVSRGVNRGLLEAVVSFGETQPLVVTEGRERRNRRTVTEVSGFLKNHPLVHDGKYALAAYNSTVGSAREPHAAEP